MRSVLVGGMAIMVAVFGGMSTGYADDAMPKMAVVAPYSGKQFLDESKTWTVAQADDLAEEQRRVREKIRQDEAKEKLLIADYLNQPVPECPKTTLKALFSSVFSSYEAQLVNDSLSKAYMNISATGLTYDGTEVDAQLALSSARKAVSFTLTSNKSGSELASSGDGILAEKLSERFMQKLCGIHFKE